MNLEKDKQNTVLRDIDYKKILKGCWIKCKILKLEKNFVEFLENEKMEIDKPILTDHLKGIKSPDEEDSGSGEWDEETPENSEVIISETERFPEFNKKLRKIIKEFDHEVFLKLDGQAALDMKNWVVDLKCQNLNDLYQILKFSDLLQDYIDKKVNEEKSYENMHLMLFKWKFINHSMEFVLEIENGNLLSVSQRKLENFYDFLRKEDTLLEIMTSLELFFETKLTLETCNQLPKKCVIDIYIDPNSANKKVLVLGISSGKQISQKLILKNERDSPDFMLTGKNERLRDVEFYILNGESEARYKIWSQDYPAEFLEYGNKGGGFDTFLEAFATDNLQSPTE